MNFNTLALC